jgi:hypothetical protein
LVVKVNVRRNGHGKAGSQITHNFGGFQVGHGEPEKRAAHLTKTADTGAQGLSGPAFKIPKGEAILPHSLNNYRMIAPDINRIKSVISANFDCPRFAAYRHA